MMDQPSALAPASEAEPFTGRDAELAMLRDLLAEAGTGVGRVVLVGGEPGIGTTRLVRELLDRSTLPAGWGRAEALPFAAALEPWSRALDAVRERLEADDAPAAAALAAASELLGGAAETGSEPEYGTIAAHLVQAAVGWPYVLVLNDLHRAGAESLRLLHACADRVEEGPLVVLATMHTARALQQEPVQSLMHALVTHRGVTSIDLQGLTEEAVRELVAGLLGVRPAAGALRAIFEDTNGNPLLVRELVQWLSEGGWTGEGAEVAPALQAAVEWRLADLSAGCRALLDIVATAGTMVPAAVLESLGIAELEAALEEAEQARLLLAVEEDGEPCFAFRHGVVRTVLYQALTSAEVVRLHARLALALEQRWRGDNAALNGLAWHFVHAAPAGLAEKAVAYARLAGERAMQAHAYDEAARWYGAAVDAESRQALGEARRLDLRLNLAEALNRAGKVVEARREFQQAAIVARSMGDGERLATAALGLGRLAIAGSVVETEGRLDELLRDALNLLPEGDDVPRARVLARLAEALFYTPARAQALTASDAALAMAERLGDPAALGAALHARRRMNSGPDYPSRRRYATQIRRMAARTGDDLLRLDAYQWQIMDLLEQARMGWAEGLIRRYEAEAERLRLPFARWRAAIWRAMRGLTRGGLVEAEALVWQAWWLRREAKDPDADMVLSHQEFFLRRFQGRLAEIEPPVRLQVELQAPNPRARARLALLYAELGEREAAQAELAQLLPLDDGPAAGPVRSALAGHRDNAWLSTATYLADTCVDLGDVARAAMMYQALLPFAGRAVVVATGVTWDGAVDRPLGRLAALLQRPEEADHHLKRALVLHQRTGSGVWTAVTSMDLGAALMARDEVAGRALIEQAVEMAQDLQMDGVVLRGEALLRHGSEARAGVRLSGGADGVRPGVASGSREDLQLRIAAARDAARLDALTGLPNRLAWNEQLDLAGNNPRTVALVDVDLLKQVNDALGHQGGDQAIVRVATVLREHLGEAGFVARIGGDEFGVLFPAGDSEHWIGVLRRLVDEAPFPFLNGVTLSLSIGVAVTMLGEQAAAALVRADVALRSAKGQGRGRLVITGDDGIGRVYGQPSLAG